MKVVKSVFILAAMAMPAFSVSDAHAATCANRADVVQALNDRFGEALYGNAISSSGNVLEVYSNATNATWTILVSLPDQGLSCLVASGEGNQRLQMQLADLRG
jgi:hypothetical protein